MQETERRKINWKRYALARDIPALELIQPILRELDRRDKHPFKHYKPDNDPMGNQEGFHKSQALVRLIFGGNQCLQKLTIIQTERGLLRAADVVVGDNLVGGKVVHKFVSPEEVPIWSIECHGGFKLSGNYEHPVMTKSGFKFLGELDEDKDEVMLVLGRETWAKQSNMTSEDAYFAGLMIGNGCLVQSSTTLSFTSIYSHHLDFITRYLGDDAFVRRYERGAATALHWSAGHIKDKMRDLWGMKMVKSCAPT